MFIAQHLTLCIPEDLEVLYAVSAFDGEREVSWAALRHPDDECALVFVPQQLLRVGTRDPTVVPIVRLHLDVI